MTSTRRPSSVRSLGARRLKQTTVVMVALGVAGVAGLVVHEAQVAHAATSTSTSTSVTQSTATDGTGTSSDMSSSSGSSTVTATQATPQATSGGS